VTLAFAVTSCTKSKDAFSAISPSSEPAAQALASDPPYACTLIIGIYYPSQGHDHLTEKDSTDFAYNSDPPTSAPVQQEVTDVGGGKLTALIKDADDNVIGLMQ
jgi:hypothetical protein